MAVEDKPERQYSALNALGLGNSEEIGKTVLDWLRNPRYSYYLAPFLMVVDTVLCSLIIRTVECTSDSSSMVLT